MVEWGSVCEYVQKSLRPENWVQRWGEGTKLRFSLRDSRQSPLLSTRPGQPWCEHFIGSFIWHAWASMPSGDSRMLSFSHSDWCVVRGRTWWPHCQGAPPRALDMGGLVSGAKERVGACPVLVFLALRAWAWRRGFRGIWWFFFALVLSWETESHGGF